MAQISSSRATAGDRENQYTISPLYNWMYFKIMQYVTDPLLEDPGLKAIRYGIGSLPWSGIDG